MQHLEIDWESVEDHKDKMENYHLPRGIKKKIAKYNRWVEETREKNKEYKAKKPNIGKREPFKDGRSYYL